MLGDSAEAQDIAQETFMRLWSNRASIADPRAVIAWLYRTSTRLAIDNYRRISKRGGEVQCLDDAAEFTLSSGPESTVEDRVHSRRLLHLVADKVPQRELEAAILSRLDGLTHEEIGHVVGASGRTIRRWLSRFDRRLADFTAMDKTGQGRETGLVPGDMTGDKR